MATYGGDPRLSWLEAFVATALHLDLKLAADRLGVDATIAKNDVEKLEAWLHKLLIIYEDPLVLFEVDGVEFLDVASGILQNFQSFTSRGGAPDQWLSFTKSKMSSIRLSELESFLSLATHENYKAAAYEVSSSSDQLRKNIRKLESIFGCKFVTGRSRIELTPLGRQFANLSNEAVAALRRSVADISKFDPAIPHLKAMRRIYTRRRIELTVVIARAERKRQPTKRHILEAQAAREELALIDESLSAIRDYVISRDGPAG